MRNPGAVLWRHFRSATVLRLALLADAARWPDSAPSTPRDRALAAVRAVRLQESFRRRNAQPLTLTRP